MSTGTIGYILIGVAVALFAIAVFLYFHYDIRGIQQEDDERRKAEEKIGYKRKSKRNVYSEQSLSKLKAIKKTPAAILKMREEQEKVLETEKRKQNAPVYEESEELAIDKSSQEQKYGDFSTENNEMMKGAYSEKEEETVFMEELTDETGGESKKNVETENNIPKQKPKTFSVRIKDNLEQYADKDDKDSEKYLETDFLKIKSKPKKNKETDTEVPAEEADDAATELMQVRKKEAFVPTEELLETKKAIERAKREIKEEPKEDLSSKARGTQNLERMEETDAEKMDRLSRVEDDTSIEGNTDRSKEGEETTLLSANSEEETTYLTNGALAFTEFDEDEDTELLSSADRR